MALVGERRRFIAKAARQGAGTFSALLMIDPSARKPALLLQTMPSHASPGSSTRLTMSA